MDTAMRAETCLAVARILVYSLGFVRLLYWHTTEIFRSYRHKEKRFEQRNLTVPRYVHVGL